MSLGYFSYPIPVNEPVLNYAPGSAEKAALKKVLAELKKEEIDIPMYIGGEEVRTGNTRSLHPPHEKAHALGHYHFGDEQHVTQAINTALKVREEWSNTPWETRAHIFLKAADLIATKYRRLYERYHHARPK
jgi:1-pyrroline-5-carboxylate dehydrogenase